MKHETIDYPPELEHWATWNESQWTYYYRIQAIRQRVVEAKETFENSPPSIDNLHNFAMTVFKTNDEIWDTMGDWHKSNNEFRDIEGGRLQKISDEAQRMLEQINQTLELAEEVKKTVEELRSKHEATD